MYLVICVKIKEESMKRIRKWTAGALALILSLTLIVPALADGDWETDVSLSATFGQSDARSMLQMINAFRTGNEAYYKDWDNATLVNSKGEPLSYSYALEEIAMQRAAEIALSFSHTRPDGTDCFSALASDGTTQSWGENIAAGNSTAEATFKQWREDDRDYSGQGHRRNMLKTQYQAVGVGHVIVNGTHYWVQEFGFEPDNAPETVPTDTAQYVTIKIASSRYQRAQNVSVSPNEGISVEAGQSVAVPVVRGFVKLTDAWPEDVTAVTVLPTWSSSDETVATVIGQQITGVKAGSAALTFAAFGGAESVSVTVRDGENSHPLPNNSVYALLYDDGELVFQHSTVSSENWRTVRETYPVDLTATDDTPPWYDERWHVEVVSFADKVSPTSTANWFSDCISLQRVDNIRNLDTSNVTSMSAMFHNCYSLTALDVSSFDTSNVTDMGSMFEKCSGLTALDVSGFDTSNVTNMYAMFWACSGLTALDVSRFHTVNVTDMSYMFASCSGLTALDLSYFNTVSVKNMENMFDGCFGLKALDVSNFNTAGVTDMSGMFWNCSGLTTLDVSRFDTAKVTQMDYMFCDCSNLTSLDLSGFDTAKVMTTESMFYGCTRLKTIYASGKFTMDSVRETDFFGSYNMFRDCTALVGGAGTKYDENHITKGYARVDNPPDAPGYFTAKDAPAPMTYTVTWKNYDGAVLKTDMGLAAGTVPAYVGNTPIRTGYAFAGWSPEPSALSGDATYTARFTEIAPILFDVTRDAYAFGNSMADFGYTSAGGLGGKHPIPADSFFVIFGKTVKAKMLYKQKTAFPWGGNCAGMSGSAALFYANTGLNPSDFGQNNVWGVGIGDKNAEMSALTLVEAMQVAQYADAFVKARQENNRTAADLRGVKNLKALFETVRTDMEAGRPTLLAIVKSGVGGHALLAIGAEEVSDTESRILIYDCNHPGETRYLTLGKDASGNLKTWRYDMGGYGVWGTGGENGNACSISYVPYAVLEEIWTNRGNQQQNSQVLTVNADNLTITDFDGNAVASVENGQFSASADGVYEIVELSMYWPKERSVCLPRNETYTLTTTDDITLTASMTDSHMSAEISTSANEVTFGVNDDEKENGVIVAGATASDTYEIALESDFADMPYKNVSLSGSGQGEDVSVSMNQDGAPQYSNVNLTSLSLNGESVSLYKILLATKDNGKLTVAFTNLYPVTVAAAYFGADGKFMSACLESVQASAGTAEFPLPTDAKTARVILCDTDCRPLCEPYEANVG